MTEEGLKTGQDLKSNSMLLIDKGTCTVVEMSFFILKDWLDIVQKALLMFL